MWHHVQRQALDASLAQPVGRHLRGADARHELPLVQNHRHADHAGIGCDGPLDLFELDALAVDLHLPIRPPNPDQHAILAPPHAIAGSEQNTAPRERVRNEPLSRELRRGQVALSQWRAADEELSLDVRFCDRPQRSVEQHRDGSVDRSADRDRPLGFRVVGHVAPRHIPGNLRRSVQIEQPAARHEPPKARDRAR